MAERLVLHIGVQKSGTTYLQQLMQHRTRELADIGVQYQLPSARRLKSGRVNHHELATYGLLGTEYPWISADRAADEQGWWQTLSTKVREWPATSIVSAEAVSVIRADAARRLVEAFGCADNTDVLITARGLGKLLPSAWQQLVRNGRSTGFDSFLGQLARERAMGWDALEKEPDAHLWRAFALGRMVDRWASIVGRDRVTLITNPGSPPEQLWHRFLEAARVSNASRLSEPEKTMIHGGVTAAEADVLSSLNVNLSSAGWPAAEIRRLDNRIIQALGEREQRGPRLGVRAAFREQVEQWSRDDIADLRTTGVQIVGDLSELAYAASSEPSEPTAADVAEAAGVAGRVAIEWGREHATAEVT